MSKLPEELHQKLSEKESSNFGSVDGMMTAYVNHHYTGGLAPKEVSKIRTDLTNILHDLVKRKKGQSIITSSNSNSDNDQQQDDAGPILPSASEDAAVSSEEDEKAAFMKKLQALKIDLNFVVDHAASMMEKK